MLHHPVQETGKDYSHEIGILYNMVIKNRQEIEELRQMLQDGRNHEITTSRDLENRIPAPIDIAPSRDAEDIMPLEEDSLLIEDGERERIKRALEISGGNRKLAAEKVGLSERTLYRKIKEYGL